MWIALAGAIVVGLQILAVVFLIRSIQTTRTPQGAVAWAFFLFFLPFIAVPVYLFLGNWRYQGYVVARRTADVVIAGARAQEDRHGAKNVEPLAMQSCFEEIAGLPIVGGNAMELLIDWQHVFNSIFEAIDAAEAYVLVQFYIVKDDEIGQALKRKLVHAAQRGVRVRLLYDAVGSKSLTNAYLSELRTAGVVVVDINRLFGPKSRFQVNFRNHRKTVVVDGRVGFTGGYNVGDEYAGKDEKFGKWRDTHCRVVGPMVQQLQLIFAEDWYGATAENIADALLWASETSPADENGVILATGPADRLDMGALYFCSMIHAAKNRIWIASPYLIAENDILAALKLAVLRGVEVRILVPKVRDHWSTWLAAFAYFDELREAGVEIWLYGDGFMHQKVILVDDCIASVGTINLDNRSCRLNFEATAVMFDRSVAAEVERMLGVDFGMSEKSLTPLHAQPLHVRYGAPVARLFAPLL